jgi:hypothetical protein
MEKEKYQSKKEKQKNERGKMERIEEVFDAKNEKSEDFPFKKKEQE